MGQNLRKQKQLIENHCCFLSETEESVEITKNESIVVNAKKKGLFAIIILH